MKDTWTAKERFDALVNNDLDHYLVDYEDGTTELKHRSLLSSILDCGQPTEDFDIARMQQCWNGEEIGEEGEV